MPLTKLSPDYHANKLQGLILSRMKALKVTGKELADMWRVTPQGANNRIRTMRMDWTDLCDLMRYLKITPDEFVEVFRC